MDSNTVIAIISGLATITIAVFAVFNYRLSKEITEAQKARDKEVSDLFAAIIISNLVSFPQGVENTNNSLKLFRKHYGERKNRTPILEEN